MSHVNRKVNNSIRFSRIFNCYCTRDIDRVRVTSSNCYGCIHADSNHIQFISRTDGQRRHETHSPFAIICGGLQRTAKLHQNQDPLRYTLKKRDAVGYTSE